MTSMEKENVFGAKGPYGQIGPASLPAPFDDEWQQSSCATPWTMNGSGFFEQAHQRVESWKIAVDTSHIDSIVFDVDGLLVNSEPLILLTIFEGAKSLLKPEFIDEFSNHAENIKKHCFGRSDEDMSYELFKYLMGRLPEFHTTQMLRDEFTSFSEQEFNEHFKTVREPTYIKLCEEGYAQPMPGAVEFIQACHQRFGQLAINTGSPEVLSRPMLEAAFDGILDLDTIFPHEKRTYVSDLEKGKPEPDGYVRASVRLNMRRERLMAVVDRGNDAISALRAGYAAVIVIPENMDFTQLGHEGTKAKHSVAKYLDGLDVPTTKKQEIASKITIAGSLAMLHLN